MFCLRGDALLTVERPSSEADGEVGNRAGRCAVVAPPCTGYLPYRLRRSHLLTTAAIDTAFTSFRSLTQSPHGAVRAALRSGRVLLPDVHVTFLKAVPLVGVQAAYGRSVLSAASFFTYVGLGLGFLASSLSLPFGLFVFICQRNSEKYIQVGCLASMVQLRPYQLASNTVELWCPGIDSYEA